MSNKILQINVRFNVPAEELAKEFETAAVPISDVPGLKWKIFGINEEQGEAAGLYLFEDDASRRSDSGVDLPGGSGRRASFLVVAEAGGLFRIGPDGP